MDPADVLPAAILFITAGAFSAFSVPVGVFVLAVTAAILTQLGWMSLSYTFLASAMGLAIIAGIAYMRGGSR